MQSYTPENLPVPFVGRQAEVKELERIANLQEASIIVVHGRRRTGKTALIEQTFQNRNLIKIEGLEGSPEEEQRSFALEQLARYTGNHSLTKIQSENWRDIFEVIAPYIKQGTWTLYFEELQWLAEYKSNFATDLKYYWDNFFASNQKLKIILCGSSPSFMRKKLVKSKALYNRSMFEIALQPFTLTETKEFLGQKHSLESVLESYLLVGGVPEYLKQMKQYSSAYLAICENSFRARSFFSEEWDKIFVSSLGENPSYRKIINYLGRVKYAGRQQIIKEGKVPGGGGASDCFADLATCGFIDAYAPYYISSDNPKLKRYCIADNYMRFYLKHIKPVLSKIREGVFKEKYDQALSIERYQQSLGYAFEFFCRKHHAKISQILGFSSVKYDSGSYFKRGSDKNYQLDLVFKRADRVLSVCEIKYSKQPIGIKASKEFESRLSQLDHPSGHSLHRVLIAPHGVTNELKEGGYFDQIIDSVESFFA